MNYDTDNFQKDVIEKSRQIPVLVDFWAEWCGPCKILGPLLERLAEKYRDRWVLAKVNTENHPELAAQYGIRSIPNVKLFVDGKVFDEFVGALPEEMIEQWLRGALPGKYREKLRQAEQLLGEGKVEEAERVLREVLAAEPDNDYARVLLARIKINDAPGEALELVSPVEADSEHFELAEALRTLGKLFQHLNAPASLPEDPVKEAYLAAIQSLRSGDFNAALEGFIEVMGINRAYDDDGPRKACIAIFKYLGEDHPITGNFRPLFSRALYS